MKEVGSSTRSMPTARPVPGLSGQRVVMVRLGWSGWHPIACSYQSEYRPISRRIRLSGHCATPRRNGDVILLPRYLKQSEKLDEVLTGVAQYVPVVCAAGNDGRSSLVYPASLKADDRRGRLQRPRLSLDLQSVWRGLGCRCPQQRPSQRRSSGGSPRRSRGSATPAANGHDRPSPQS